MSIGSCKMAIIECAIDSTNYDTFEEARSCLHNCAEEDYGLPCEYEILEDEEVRLE